MCDEKDDNKNRKRRVALFGINRQRVANVLALFKEGEERNGHAAVKNNIEYIACVASFSGYRDENGNLRKYLAKVEYHASDGNDKVGQSLAPLLDDDDGNLVAIAIGCGIDDDSDRDMVINFIATLLSGSSLVENVETNNNAHLDNLIIECAAPSNGFNSMREENEYFRGLNSDERHEVYTKRTMGPGKMVGLLCLILEKLLMKEEKVEKGNSDMIGSKQDENEDSKDLNTFLEEETSSKGILPSPDLSRNRYACKICRTVLFGEDDIEDPPHLKGKHTFSRQNSRSSNSSMKCNNVFLSSGINWMGDMSAFEGRLECPKCSAKVGHWNWSGAQCSCGSWVTPAIYFPLSKVDIKEPIHLNPVRNPQVFP